MTGIAQMLSQGQLLNGLGQLLFYPLELHVNAVDNEKQENQSHAEEGTEACSGSTGRCEEEEIDNRREKGNQDDRHPGQNPQNEHLQRFDPRTKIYIAL